MAKVIVRLDDPDLPEIEVVGDLREFVLEQTGTGFALQQGIGLKPLQVELEGPPRLALVPASD